MTALRFVVTWAGAVRRPDHNTVRDLGDLEDELLRYPGVFEDPGVSYDRSSHRVEVDVIVTAADALDAIYRTSMVARLAVESALVDVRDVTVTDGPQ